MSTPLASALNSAPMVFATSSTLVGTGMRAKWAVCALFLVGAALAARAGDPPGDVVLGFEPGGRNGLPNGWQAINFPSVPIPTSYALVASGTVLQARADASASFVVRRTPDHFDIDKTPLLRWRWRVDRTILPGDGASKATDDFPARVWVGFQG